MYAWGARNFDNDYQNRDYVNALNALRAILQTQNGLTSSGCFVTPDNSPSNLPGRGGGVGGNSDGGGVAA